MAVSLFWFGVNLAQSEVLNVTRAAIATSIENKEPKGDAGTFPSTVDRLIAFTRIEGAEVPTQVTHVWYHGDQKRFELNLPVGAKSWRTWSEKRILPEWTGGWRVEVLSSDGKLLKKLEFKIE